MRKIIVFSGAGLSADSGLDTYRGNADGIWSKYDLDKVCNYHTWRDNYDLVHEFYNKARVAMNAAEPNVMYLALVELETAGLVINITQNVDTLLEKAGASNVLHVHGTISDVYCVNCGHRETPDGEFVSTSGCPKCRGATSMKPDVVFFNEVALAYIEMTQALAGLEDDDFLVVIGTSSAVVDIYNMARFLKCNKIACIYHPSEYEDVEHFDKVFCGSASETAPKLLEYMRKEFGEEK